MTTLRRFLAFIEPGRRARWLGLGVLALVMSGMEAGGALLIYLVLRLVAEPDVDLTLPVLGDLGELFPGLSTTELVTWIAALIAAFFVLRALVTVGVSYIQARVTEDAGVRLSSRLHLGYLRMPYPFHLQRNSAELMRNASESVSVIVGSTLTPIVRLASEAFVVVALLIVLFAAAPIALLLAVVVLAPVVFGLLRYVQPRLAELGRVSHALGETTLKSLQQSFHGLRDVKVLGRERFFHERFRTAREGVARAHYLRRPLGEAPRIALETAVVLFVLVVLVVSLRGEGAPQESLAVLGLFGYAALRILPAVNKVILQINDLRFGAAAAAKVHDDLMLIEQDQPWTHAHADEGDDDDVLRLRDRISVEGVRYRYEGADVDALAGVDLTIACGESVGLVGPSGGGKTTLVDVILGLLPPDEGVVRVDGVDIQTCRRAWHRNLGVVPQSVYLVDDTLRRNIALGVEDDEIDEERVREAVQLAQLDPFVAALPAGLDTVVGERGVRVSGGQRQRVAIARALYRKPDVLIFDEGTSALDNLTEAELIEELERLRGRHTMIIVAHRLTTVRRCDRIALVSEGRIVDVGSYDELLERSPDFQQLAR